MARINLLPWREERRQIRKREFFTLLGVVLIGAVVAVFGAMQFFDRQIELQNERIRYVEAEIVELDNKIKEIESLEKRKEELLQRQKIIEDLQSQRHIMVHLFDELVTTIPDGVFLTGIKQSGTTLELTGRAQSNAQVSKYMRNLDASDWLKGTDLGIVEIQENKGPNAGPQSVAEASARNNFRLSVQIENPNAPPTENEQAPGTAPPPAAAGVTP